MSDRAKQFLRLLLRSPDRGDGWRLVSKMVWPLVQDFEHPELIEFIQDPDGTNRVRLTERGKIVADYV